MNKEILDLIIQIERCDYVETQGHNLRNNQAYVDLVNKFKQTIDVGLDISLTGCALDELNDIIDNNRM